MKTLRMLLIALALSVTPAFAWNCTTPGQVRVQVPTGTKGTGTGDGSGQVVVDSGLTFICEALPVATTQPPSSNTNSNTNNNSSASNSSTSASVSAKQKQQQSQNQSQTANGGNSTSSSTSASTSTGGNAVGNGVNSNNSITNVAAPKIPVASAITPPILPTVPCFKGYGGSAQTMAFGASFGGGKVDKGCNARELARSFSGPQTTASCKILLATKEAQAAGITMEDCLPIVAPIAVVAPSPVLVAPTVTLNLVLPSGDLIESNRTVTHNATRKAVHRRMRPCQNDSWVN
jgi:hypothetical protein